MEKNYVAEIRSRYSSETNFGHVARARRLLALAALGKERTERLPRYQPSLLLKTEWRDTGTFVHHQTS